MTAAAFNKMSTDLTPKILGAFEGLTADKLLTSREICERAIEAAGLKGKLSEKEVVSLANLYSKRVSSLARPGVDKLFRDPNRQGREFSYRIFKDGDVNVAGEGKGKPTAAASTGAKPSAARGVKVELDVNLAEAIANMGVDEALKVQQLANERVVSLTRSTAKELEKAQSQLARIGAMVAPATATA